jgi:hypothetical protein
VAISAASAPQRQALSFVDATIKDWSEFFAGLGCHPSAKGYAAIAANAVQPLARSPDALTIPRCWLAAQPDRVRAPTAGRRIAQKAKEQAAFCCL